MVKFEVLTHPPPSQEHRRQLKLREERNIGRAGKLGLFKISLDTVLGYQHAAAPQLRTSQPLKLTRMLPHAPRRGICSSTRSLRNRFIITEIIKSKKYDSPRQQRM